MRMHRLAFLAAAATIVLAACAEPPKIPGITPYRMEIQQGNFVTQEMVSRLEPGMSKDQVRSILGTPLLADIFHADRWDYLYTREGQDGKREERRLVVHFSDGKLVRLDGDVVARK
jgi:outer membrane protein assembly factor BamE